MNLRLLGVLGCAAMVGTLTVASAADAPQQFKLYAQNNSGETGTATLLQSSEGPLIVTVRTSGGGEVAQPVHIHKGTCDKLDPKPAYPLTTLMDGKSETKVPNVKLSMLTAGTYAINIHKSTTDIGTYVACGNLKVAGK